MASLQSSPAWKALEAHHRAVAGVHMRDLFAGDAERFSRFSLTVGEVFLDYAKNRITAGTMALLFDLARQADVEGWRERMFRGEKINTTEGRAVLHTALRNRSGPPVFVDGGDVTAKVDAVLAHMGAFADAVRDGAWTGETGKPVTDVVNIGIGGSDLGPAMVVEARLEDVPVPSGAELRRVVDAEGVAHYREVAAEAWTSYGIPPEVTATVFSNDALLLAPHVVAVVAYVDDAPLSAAFVLLSHGIAGIYWVSSVSGARGRGLGEACTRAVTNAGFDLGARAVSLQASPMGDAIYRRMGYVEISKYRMLWSPPPDPAKGSA